MAQQKRGPGRPVSEENEKDFRNFWGPEDKGAAKPAFCYPRRVDNLREEVQGMERKEIVRSKENGSFSEYSINPDYHC